MTAGSQAATGPPGRGGTGERRQFLRNNALGTSAAVLGGILGFGMQAIASHALHPGDYGKAAAVVGFFTLATPGTAFGRLVAWQTSQDVATAATDRSASGRLLRSLTVRLFVVGVGFVALAAVLGPTAGGFLHVPASYIVVGATTVPFTLAAQPLLGVLQGEQRFVPWNLLNVFVAFSRLVLVVGLVYPFGAFGVILGTATGAAAVFFVCLFVVRREITAHRGPYDWKPVIPFMLIGLSATFAVGVFVSIDVILVEHYFPKVQAGQYAAVAVIGNAVFFVTSSVANVVFPSVASRHARDRSTVGIMSASLGLCMGIGLIGALALQVVAKRVLVTFAGKQYAGGAHLLGWYAVGMAVLGCVVILIYTQQSLNRLGTLWVLTPIIVIRPLLLVLFHGTLLTVVTVSNLTVIGFGVAMLATYVVTERSRVGALVQSRPPAVPAPPPAAPRPTAPAPEPRPVPAAVGSSTWLTRHPKAFVGMLAAAGLAVWHAWLTTKPLASGDWNWQSSGALAAWSPWPAVWNDTLGLTGENRFTDIFRFPIYALTGILGTAGASFSVIEKLVYFLPCAVLLPLAGWLLAREVLGSTRWTLLAPVLMLGSAFTVIEANSELPLLLSEVVCCLAMVTFIRCMRRVSFRWGLATGVLLAVSFAVDLRPSYLTLVMMVGYIVILSVAEPGRRLFFARMRAAAAGGVALAASQAFWIVPFLTYHGKTQLPIPLEPDFNIITLDHGIASVSPFWTGGFPSNLVEAALNPLFMVLPLVAMLVVVRRRLSPELLWLALSAVVAAFLAKTNTPPFGGVYNMLYKTVPGFNLFREGSKFLFVTTIGYAVLAPAALQQLQGWSARNTRAARIAVRGTTMASLGLLLVTAGWVLSVTESGHLGSTTTPVAEPKAFTDVNKLLAADRTRGSVLWFGSPVYQTPDQKSHRFLVTSATHPSANLTGNGSSAELNRRDYLQFYCATSSQPYCYLTPEMFPYLVGMAGAEYIVSPASQSMGVLPTGITRAWIHQQLEALFGPPALLGTPGQQVYLWHLHLPEPLAAAYPAVAAVQSGPWSLDSVEPALQAMGLPASYSQTADYAQFPAAPAGLPQSIDVLPRLDGACTSPAAGSYGIMAQTSDATLAAQVGGTTALLPRLAVAGRAPGWSVYGPVSLPAGATPVSPAGTTTTTVGPCVAWTPLGQAAFGPRAEGIAGITKTSSNGEKVVSRTVAPAGSWVQLRLFFDTGWRLHGAKPVTAGSGLFDLYHVGRATPMKFTFSTLKWERIGQVISLLAALLTLLFLLRPPRWARKPRPVARAPGALLEGRVAPHLGTLGVVFMGLTALAVLSNWLGLPSLDPSIGIGTDPYGLDIVFGMLALGLLGLSMVTRLVEHALLSNRAPAPARQSARPRGRARVAAAAAVASVLVTGCSVGASGATEALLNAQANGAPSRNVSYSSLDEAQVNLQARHQYRCVANYTKALQAFPSLASAFAGRAACYQSAGYDAQASVHDFTKALTLEPDSPTLLIRRAAAERASGDNPSALRDYLAAAAAPSSAPTTILLAIEGMISLGHLTDAVNTGALLDRRFPGSPIDLVAISDLDQARGSDTAAGVALDQAAGLVAQDPNDLPYVLARQCAYQVLHHQYTAAATVCDEAATTGQDGAGAFDNLSAVDLAQGRLTAAVADLTSAIGAFEGNVGPNAQPSGVNGFGLANLLKARALVYTQLQDPPAALRDFDAALAALPPSAANAITSIRGDIKAIKRG